MEEPLISVIVPVYGAEQYFGRCVESILNQTYRNLEIILIDDGSPDKCPAMCDEFARRDDRVKVIHQENQGPTGAVNVGLDAATGDYIAFVDNDDWLEATAYEDMMRLMLDKGVSVVSCAVNIVSGGTVKEVRFREYPEGSVVPHGEIVKKLLTDEMGNQGWNFLSSRRCWEKTRYSGLRYSDIVTTYLAIDRADGNIGFTQKALYNYRLNQEGISLTKDPVKPYDIFLGFRGHYEYAKLHYPEVRERCLVLAASFAISTVFNYYSHRPEALAKYVPEAEEFLHENKAEIRRAKGYMRSRKLAIDAYFFSKPAFRVLARLCDKIVEQA